MNVYSPSAATPPSPPVSTTKPKLEVDHKAISTHEAIKTLDGKNLYDRICFATGIFVLIAFLFPPVNTAVRFAFKGVTVAVKATEKAIDYAIPNQDRTPERGDVIAGYTVTSVYGKRQKPCPTCSDEHKGTDLGTPVGTQIYAIGNQGDKVWARCRPESETGGGGKVLEVVHPKIPFMFQYLHLSKCPIPAGEEKQFSSQSVIALTGNTGTSTGPHLHFGQIKNPKFLKPSDLVGKEYVAPYEVYMWWSMTGEQPKPTVSTGDGK